MGKNPCSTRVTLENAYEVYQSSDRQTIHWVLKKYKSPVEEAKDRFASWYVASKSPGTFGSYEYGDTYAENIKQTCVLIDNPLCSYVCARLDDKTTFSLNMLLKYRYTDMRLNDAMLVNYVRMAVPKRKLDLFKQTAQAHNLTIVCIDMTNEVHQCRNDLHNTQQEENNG